MLYEIETTFSCAHFYKLADWSDEQNRRHFGKCFSADERGHGHNYRLRVFIQLGSQALSDHLREKIKSALQILREELDHHHLNFDIPGLRGLVPTTENLARYCYQKLQHGLQLPFHVQLFETPELWVEIYE